MQLCIYSLFFFFFCHTLTPVFKDRPTQELSTFCTSRLQPATPTTTNTTAMHIHVSVSACVFAGCPSLRHLDEQKSPPAVRVQLAWFAVFSGTAGLVYNDHDDCCWCTCMSVCLCVFRLSIWENKWLHLGEQVAADSKAANSLVWPLVARLFSVPPASSSH